MQVLKQDKPSDVEVQPPFGDLKQNKTLERGGGGEGGASKTKGDIMLFWQSIKRCARRTFWKIIPQNTNVDAYNFYTSENIMYFKYNFFLANSHILHLKKTK